MVRTTDPSACFSTLSVFPSASVVLAEVPGLCGCGLVTGGGVNVPLEIKLPEGPVTVCVTVPSGCFCSVIMFPFASLALAKAVAGSRGCGFVAGGGLSGPCSRTYPPASVTVRVTEPSGLRLIVVVRPFSSVVLAVVVPGCRGGTLVGLLVTGPDSVVLPLASVTVRVVVPSGFFVMVVVFPFASVVLAVVVPGLRGGTFVGSG